MPKLPKIAEIGNLTTEVRRAENLPDRGNQEAKLKTIHRVNTSKRSIWTLRDDREREWRRERFVHLPFSGIASNPLSTKARGSPASPKFQREDSYAVTKIFNARARRSTGAADSAAICACPKFAAGAA